MHINPNYGVPTQWVSSVSISVTHADIDHWQSGQTEQELNQKGAYIHRFKKNGNAQQFDMPMAVNKMLEEQIPTPVTYVGPSFNRTYNHYAWESCAGLLFASSLPHVLAYKGDIYSARLQGLNKNHQHFKQATQPNQNLHSTMQYAQYITKEFNRLGPTTSAFKFRRTKQLQLVCCAEYHQAKAIEINQRVNAYFQNANAQTIQLDRPSKYIIHDHLHSTTQFTTITCKELVEKIEQLKRDKPELALLLNPPLLKLKLLNDEGARAYMAKAKQPTSKAAHLLHYSKYLEHHFSTQGGGYTNADPMTAIPPNEALALPTHQHLMGVLVDPARVFSFDQVMATHEYLMQNPKTKDRASVIAPYMHNLSHQLDHSLIQLGWSRHILPWTRKGLLELAETNKITAIDHQKFTPNLFELLGRVAENGLLQIHGEYQPLGLMNVKTTIPTDLYAVQNAQGTPLIVLAGCNPNLHERTFKLLCFVVGLNSQGVTQIKSIVNHNQACRTAKQVAAKYLEYSNTDRKKAFDELVTDGVNAYLSERQKSKRFQNEPYGRVFRSGHHDMGWFQYNPMLGSMYLQCGQRTHAQQLKTVAVFQPCNDMRSAGATAWFGIDQLQKQSWALGFLAEQGLQLGYFSVLVHLDANQNPARISVAHEIDDISLQVHYPGFTTEPRVYVNVLYQNNRVGTVFMNAAGHDGSNFKPENPEFMLNVLNLTLNHMAQMQMPNHARAKGLVFLLLLYMRLQEQVQGLPAVLEKLVDQAPATRRIKTVGQAIQRLNETIANCIQQMYQPNHAASADVQTHALYIIQKILKPTQLNKLANIMTNHLDGVLSEWAKPLNSSMQTNPLANLVAAQANTPAPAQTPISTPVSTPVAAPSAVPNATVRAAVLNNTQNVVHAATPPSRPNATTPNKPKPSGNACCVVM